MNNLPKEIVQMILGELDDFALFNFAKSSIANLRAVFQYLKEIQPDGTIAETLLLNHKQSYLPLIKAKLLGKEISRIYFISILAYADIFKIYMTFLHTSYEDLKRLGSAFRIGNIERLNYIVDVFLKEEYLPIVKKMLYTDLRRLFIPAIICSPPYSARFLGHLILSIDDKNLARRIYLDYIETDSGTYNFETIELIRKKFMGMVYPERFVTPDYRLSAYYS